MPSNPDRRMLRVAEAATFLGLSVSYLNKLRCNGGSPRYIKTGRAVLYDPADLETWLAERRQQSTSDRMGTA
jgi:excisionase family DNA binding protein